MVIEEKKENKLHIEISKHSKSIKITTEKCSILIPNKTHFKTFKNFNYLSLTISVKSGLHIGVTNITH